MKIESLRLFHFPGSRSARVRWALLETFGDDFELLTLKLLQGEQYAADFLEMNPNHAVPVLEITWSDGSVQTMLESTAMVEWLADAFPEKQLAPQPGLSRERADYLQMLQFGGNWMDAMLWQIRVHRDLLPEADSDPKSVDRAMEKISKEVAPQLHGRLASSEYICGADFSAADIVIGHCLNWARAYGLCQEDVFKAYASRLGARPAFQKAFDDVVRK
ncbi:glutathione S-transferase family protein [Congregibacter litoralis]|uniref:Glutathione S-transferase n=1 Tax=Congregibacter litoralis KT71 TaxID=314285 RepID=A4A728_9GAMM|nr:glutathione S-transferase family protein [Congregibacter litoralis]EAQ98097.1 Glutathione S-transferase [Congregibacter litoralis KT71]